MSNSTVSTLTRTMLFKIPLYLLIIKCIYGQNSLFDKSYLQNSNSRTTECIASLIRKYFPCGSLMTLVDTRANDELIMFLKRDMECYIFTVRTFYDEDLYVPTSSYIIRAENVAEFSDSILNITNDLFWNPRGRFIIEIKVLEENEVDIVFNILVQHNVYDVILIRNRTNDIVIDTYFPYKNNNCGKRVEVVTIGDCTDITNLEWIADKIYSLRNCTLIIAATQSIPDFIFEESHFTYNGKPLLGLEQLLLETIAEKEGIKLKYLLMKREHSYGVVLRNFTATGLLSSLQNKAANIAAGGFILIKNRVTLFDYVWGYHYATFKVYTPSLGEEVWKDIYKVFSRVTWFLILMAFGLVALTSTMKQKLFLRRNENHSMILKLWGYLFLNTSSKLSRDGRYKTVMLFWIWFSFFMCNFYNSELYSLLTSRKDIKRHISPDRLRELPFQSCTSKIVRTFFLYAYHQTLPEGINNSECRFRDTALDYTATKKISYTIDLDYFYKLHTYKYVNEKGKSLVDSWTFSRNLPVAIFFEKGFPLRDEFQYYALRMFESGILRKNLDEIYRNHNHRPQQLRKVHYEKMMLNDLRIHFYILLLGHIISLLCFILEILWYRNSWRFYHIRYAN